MRVSDVISNVTKQNKTWTSWRQGTKLRVRLSLANARFASLLSKVMYIIKRKFKCLSWIWLLFHLMKWKKCIFHSCLRHEWNVHFFTSLDEIKVIFTPNIWISSICCMFLRFQLFLSQTAVISNQKSRLLEFWDRVHCIILGVYKYSGSEFLVNEVDRTRHHKVLHLIIVHCLLLTQQFLDTA